MDTTSTFGQAAAQNSTTDTSASGNDDLSAAFDKAIEEAQQTLATTTVKGAELYALKQSVR